MKDKICFEVSQELGHLVRTTTAFDRRQWTIWPACDKHQHPAPCPPRSRAPPRDLPKLYLWMTSKLSMSTQLRGPDNHSGASNLSHNEAETPPPKKQATPRLPFIFGRQAPGEHGRTRASLLVLRSVDMTWWISHVDAEWRGWWC